CGFGAFAYGFLRSGGPLCACATKKNRIACGMIAVDSVLVVNAGSFSVKFQVFAVERSGELKRRIKGPMDGIGPRLGLRASGADGVSIVDREYRKEEISSVPAALETAGVWLREEQHVEPSTVGHRVVHGGPDYDRPVLINAKVLAQLESYTSLAP